MVEMLNRAEGTSEGACCARNAHARQRARTAPQGKKERMGSGGMRVSASDGDEPQREDDMPLGHPRFFILFLNYPLFFLFSLSRSVLA